MPITSKDINQIDQSLSNLSLNATPTSYSLRPRSLCSPTILKTVQSTKTPLTQASIKPDTLDTLPLEKKKVRQNFSYGTNATISRQASSETGVNKCGRTEQEDRIDDHVTRRIVIFYYLLVAYYKQGCKVELDTTNLQHGKSHSGCHAAHSSVIANIKDNFFPRLVKNIKKEGVTDETAERLKSIGICNDIIQKLNKKLKPEQIKSLLGIGTSGLPTRLFSDKSHFYQNMNATVELPKEVNYYDRLVEKTIRKHGIQLLNDCSKGNQKPYEALKIFIYLLNAFYSETKQQAKAKKDLLHQIINQDKEVGVKQAALIQAQGDERLKALRSYLNAIYVYRAMESRFRKLGSHTPGLDAKDAQKGYMTIIDKMHRMKENERESAERLGSRAAIKKYAQQILQSYEENEVDSDRTKKILFKIMESKDASEARTALISYFIHCDWPDFLLSFPANQKILMDIALKQIKKHGPWETHNYKKTQNKIERAVSIMQSQKKSTILPPYELLSGTLRGGKLVGMTDEELLEGRAGLFK